MLAFFKTNFTEEKAEVHWMKVFVYGYREEEADYFEKCKRQYGIEVETCSYKPTKDNIHLANGYTCISMLSTPMPKDLIEILYQNGTRFISTRTVGYDHIDMDSAKQLGMHIGNATYAPESVADYTIMLILMTLRKMKLIMKSAEIQDYSFTGVQGKNLKGKTVGVIGTGSIGKTLIQHINGFGCNIIAYSRHQDTELTSMVSYVDLDTLYKESDIITLHLPLTKDTRHIINKKSIASMKDGVILINTARGGLIDNCALIEGIESGKLSGAGLDVVEGEVGIYYNNRKASILNQREMAILQTFPNVIMSPHMAFLTEESNHDMVIHSMMSCVAYMTQKNNPWLIL